jgi:hypothetical protein
MPWWTSPLGITIGFLLPVLFLIAYVGETNHPGLAIRGTRFLSLEYIALGACLLLIIALSGWLGGNIYISKPEPTINADWDRIAFLLGCVAIAAYILWFREFIFNPGLLLSTFLGEHRPDRTNIQKTAGLTSFVSFSLVFFSIYAYRICLAAATKPAPLLNWMFAVLVCFTLFRVYAWSERLAFIEAMLPFGLALGRRLMLSTARQLILLRWLGPFAAIPMLVLYFGVAESVRSWASAFYSGKMNFWDFAIGRFATYYYTSLNNGAGVLATTDWPTYKFENVLAWLHRAPMSVGQLFSTLVELTSPVLDTYLHRYGDVEFNNPSGLYAVVADFGLPLSIMYFSITSFAGGILFRAYHEDRFVGIICYPVFYISLLEIFRYPYLGTSRAFAWALGILLALILVRRAR